MNDRPVALTPPPTGYADWLVGLKARIHSAQQRATLLINRAIVQRPAAQLPTSCQPSRQHRLGSPDGHALKFVQPVVGQIEERDCK
jgi:hypothetical protein